AILVVLALLLGGWYGYKYWQKQQEQKLVAVAEQYHELLQKLNSKDPATIEAMTAFSQGTETVYSVLANMQAAKYYVQRKDYGLALADLLKAREQSKDTELSNLINFRAARLQYQLAHYEDALATLELVKEQSWTPIINELKGDIYTTLGDYSSALQQYQSL